MLTLINTNLMRPAIAPIGLDYIAAATRAACIETEIVDLCLAEDPEAALRRHFAGHAPTLVGLSFRNTDDSFYPSMQSFLPVLRRTLEQVRRLTDAPIVLGGSGYSIFPQRILEYTGADFGVRGDGEPSLIALAIALQDNQPLDAVPGLVRRVDGAIITNPSAWPDTLSLSTARSAIDNRTYLRLGGQIGLETKRGCDRRCIFCADVLGKGHVVRPRSPAEVAEEAEVLLAQGVDVLHLCDAEFNIPYAHAMATCKEFVARGLGRRLRWYAYLAVVPFDGALAAAMRAAGCVGINFTGPAASDAMLAAYRQVHRQRDIAATVRACRDNGITTMLDLMFGGPGETPATVAEAIGFVKGLPIDCAGAGLGVRLYPGLPMLHQIAAEGPLASHPGIRRRYDGPIDLMEPTYYVSPALGGQGARLIRNCIAGDKRFFEPADDADAAPAGAAAGAGTAPAGCASTAAPGESRGYNYNDNDPLVRAIAAGARGAYWDILRRSR